MQRLTSTQWCEFKKTIGGMPNDAKPREILNAILSWLRQYSEIFSCDPFLFYQFNKFININDKNLPVEASPMHGIEFENFRKIIYRYKMKDIESIARYLRDVLERLIILEVDRQCPRCDYWGLGIFKDSKDGRVIFECKQCGFSMYEDGSRANDSEFSFAESDDLRNAGLI